MPLPRRYLTSLMMRYNGHTILIDCGEGTQVAVKRYGWSYKQIDVICITHFHADHISGLPGLLLTIGNTDRRSPLLIVGPKGLSRVVNSLRVIAPELPFPIEFHEWSEKEESLELFGLNLHAFRVNHNITCYGYHVSLDRVGRFDTEKAKANGVPMPCWSKLQKEETVVYEGKEYRRDMVLGEERKGLKLTYCTDTRPTDLIVKYATDADLFICEGMYGEEDHEDKAKGYKHMTMYEAAEIAKKAGPKELWLTHYSPSLVQPKQYTEAVRAIFAQTTVSKDGQMCTLDFEEE